MMGETYAGAGVDIDLKSKVIKKIAQQVRRTYRPEVLSGVGPFGGLYEFKGYEEPVLVSSTDSVGTKLKIANVLGKHDTVGIDIVNHCINDILTCGAEPLFFLDYIGIGKVVPERLEAIVQGLVQACHEVNCALIGGEIAEMPSVYAGEDYDLVGFVVGVVEKKKIITGENIIAGDSLIGLPSSGLHTNGYSLVRKIFGETRATLDTNYPELGRPLGEELLEPHRCYYNQLKPLLTYIKGMAHITGGGLIDNVPRILPDGMAARFDSRTWTTPPIFRLIQQRGNVDRDEMYRVFNMGLGMVVVCSPGGTRKFTEALPEAEVVGEVVKQSGEVRTIIE
jgi:phosphoribosylformylglycinamidine cyclo-ligase